MAKPARDKSTENLAVETAREAALKLLAKRMLSRHELDAKLKRLGYSEAEIADAAELARSYGYLNDATLAEAVVREAERTGHGPAWVLQTLLRRGVAESVAAAAERTAQTKARERAEALLIQRFGMTAQLDESARRRAQRFLAGRGFSADCALALLGDCEQSP